MKKLLLLVLAFSTMAFSTTNEPIIKWTPTKKLKISDFNQSLTPLPNGATAITYSGMFMERDNTRPCGWRSYGVFDKSQSVWYVYGQSQFKELILQHEQLHFDITNYMSMQLDKELKSFTYTLDQNTLDNLYNQYRGRLDSMQVWYDKSSDHSRDSLSQSRWNRYVDSLLRK